MIDDLLTRLDQLLRDRRPDYYAALQSPADAAEIDALRRLVAHPLPEALIALLRWKNGQPRQVCASLHLYWSLMPVAEIAAAKTMLDGEFGDDGDYWRRDWLPFLGSADGDHLCVDLNPENGNRIVCYGHATAELEIEFASIEDWLEAVVAWQETDEASNQEELMDY